MQSKHNQPCGLGDIAVSELELQLDAAAAEERYSVFWCNVGDAGKHAVANFMADVCQTGKVVALAQLEDNRVFLMVKAGAQTGDLNAPLDHEQMVPIKTHWDELDDYVALRLLFNSCSQFEGVEDEIPNDTGHLYVISAKGERRDAIEEAGTGPAKKNLTDKDEALTAAQKASRDAQSAFEAAQAAASNATPEAVAAAQAAAEQAASDLEQAKQQAADAQAKLSDAQAAVAVAATKQQDAQGKLSAAQQAKAAADADADAAQASYDAAKADLDRAEQGAAGPEYEAAKAKVVAASEALTAAKATQSQCEGELATAEQDVAAAEGEVQAA